MENAEFSYFIHYDVHLSKWMMQIFRTARPRIFLQAKAFQETQELASFIDDVNQRGYLFSGQGYNRVRIYPDGSEQHDPEERKD